MRKLLILSAILAYPALSTAAECPAQRLPAGTYALSATFPDATASELCFARLGQPAIADTCTAKRLGKVSTKGCSGASVNLALDYGSVVVELPVGRWEFVAYAKGPWEGGRTIDSADRFVIVVQAKPPAPPELLGVIAGLELVLQSLKAMLPQ